MLAFLKKFANVLNEWSLIKESNDLRLLLLPLTYVKPIPISTPLEVIRKPTVFRRYVIRHWLKMSYCSLWTWSSFWAWLYFAFMKLIFKVSLEGCFKRTWKLNGLSELDSFKKHFLLASNLAFQLCCHMFVICHYDVCSKLTTKTPYFTGFLVFLLLTLNK